MRKIITAPKIYELTDHLSGVGFFTCLIMIAFMTIMFLLNKPQNSYKYINTVIKCLESTKFSPKMQAIFGTQAFFTWEKYSNRL